MCLCVHVCVCWVGRLLLVKCVSQLQVQVGFTLVMPGQQDGREGGKEGGRRG